MPRPRIWIPLRSIVLAELALAALITPAPSRSQFVAPRPRPNPRQAYIPTGCFLIDKLGLDYLEDDLTGAPAVDTRHGTMPAKEDARFRVYALDDDSRFFVNISHERHYIRARVSTAEGSRPVRGYVRYVQSGAGIYWNLRIPRRTVKDRKAIVTFTYTCPYPRRVYKREFELDIPGTAHADIE